MISIHIRYTDFSSAHLDLTPPLLPLCAPNQKYLLSVRHNIVFCIFFFKTATDYFLNIFERHNNVALRCFGRQQLKSFLQGPPPRTVAVSSLYVYKRISRFTQTFSQVITGPKGSGKSYIAKDAIKGRQGKSTLSEQPECPFFNHHVQ